MVVIKTQFTPRLTPTDYAKIKKNAEIENRSMTNMKPFYEEYDRNAYQTKISAVRITKRRNTSVTRRLVFRVRTIITIENQSPSKLFTFFT